MLGGVGRLENYLSDVTRYVVEKAPCRVILTAPPGNDDHRSGDEGGRDGSGAARPAG